MDDANLAVAWLSFAATAVGLGGLITQASAINDQLDPFHSTRTAEYLGIWFQRQQRFPWWKITKPPPLGPVISARMADGFCGVNVLHVTRIPLLPPGKAGWSILIAMFNDQPPVLQAGDGGVDDAAAEKGPLSSVVVASAEVPKGAEKSRARGGSNWGNLEQTALTRHQSYACITVSRTTLITMLVATNGRPVFQYSDATGFRAGYASYCGQWYITWPIGQEAIVKFAAHDSIGKTEVLPRSFAQRIDRCGQMVSGVVSSPTSSFSVGFGGRKSSPGAYRLEHAIKGFQGAHSGRHLYNMMGGKAYQVDFMIARPIADDDEIQIDAETSSADLVLHLPSKAAAASGSKTRDVRLHVPPHEQDIIRHALDCLPWTSLSWSMHRGLRDLLLAYSRPLMDAHRAPLAALLQQTVSAHPALLRARGWDPQFVRENMALMASSAILSAGGNSGDSVRVVTDIVAVYLATTTSTTTTTTTDSTSEWGFARLDEVSFWRPLGRADAFDSPKVVEPLDPQAVVALTKVFVLEWSQEFDYQLYHFLPISLLFG
ncbi:uncharacterized protein GGS25DRAFT_523501 [Hypoxylon fragiforme]|uniref:uncharacterized protein n=1 Tax=Hypoxylon fragiforme TaxID=63214 RepID=UPI0020C63D31|nr:uncharacterized protein GGS25DRAFT_523501 [Hypoxylon fragiforme]KAI2605827.1 hypothetical protein GGS25DRAFT_523501 [Hypoxylon fragiforme]